MNASAQNGFIIFLFGIFITIVWCQTANPPVGGNLDNLIESIFNQNQPPAGGNVPPIGGGVGGGPVRPPPPPPPPTQNVDIGVLQGIGGATGPGNGAQNPPIGLGGNGGGLIPGVGSQFPPSPPSGPSVPIGGGLVPGAGTPFPGNGGNGGNGGNVPTDLDQPQSNPCGAGECVPYYQCANGTIITDGEGLLDIRIGEDTDVHPCKGLFETCCHLKSEVPLIPDTHINEGCGFRNAEGVGFRITGNRDNEAQFGEFPWMIAILREEKLMDRVFHVFQCGGSLIHPSVVLTAAHCVVGKDPSSLKIRAGEWDTQTKDEIFPHQDRNVVEYVINEHYYKGGLFNDIALLFLDTPTVLAENVNTACMPPQDFSFDRSDCFVSGWGKDQFGREGKFQVILKRIEVPIVPRARCQQELRKTRLGRYFELHQSFICAGGEPGKDTCKGDGGSPLVCPIPGTINRYYQAGIVSWGIGCGGDVPGVYVNVPLFRKWIDEQCRLKNININSYIYLTGRR